MAGFLGSWTEHDMGACRMLIRQTFFWGKDPKIRQTKSNKERNEYTRIYGVYHEVRYRPRNHLRGTGPTLVSVAQALAVMKCTGGHKSEKRSF